MAAANNMLHLILDNHLENISGLFHTLYNENKLIDVTLACRDGSLRAHKIILSACSPFFERIFNENPCKHPIVILRGIFYHEMQMILEFMYKGFTNIPANCLNNLMCIASDLEIKGFENFKSVQNSQEGAAVSNMGRAYHNSTEAAKSGPTTGQIRVSKEIFLENRLPPATTITHGRDTRYRGQKRVAVDHFLDDWEPTYEKRSTKTTKGNAAERSLPEALQMQYPGMVITGVSGADGSTVNYANNKNPNPTNYFEPQCKTEQMSRESSPWLEIDENPVYFCETTATDPDDALSENKGYDSSSSVEATPTGQKLNCSICYYKCRSKKDLLVHQNVHKKGKRHKCEFCTSSFTRSSHLARHRRMHTGERPFTCELCGKNFARQDKLKLHVRTSHGGVNMADEILKYNDSGEVFRKEADVIPTVLPVEPPVKQPELERTIKQENIDLHQSEPAISKQNYSAPPAMRTQSYSLPSEFTPEVKQKRGRGRPRKYPPPIPVPPTFPKRGRGRPRKVKPEVSESDSLGTPNQDVETSFGEMSFLPIMLPPLSINAAPTEDMKKADETPEFTITLTEQPAPPEVQATKPIEEPEESKQEEENKQNSLCITAIEGEAPGELLESLEASEKNIISVEEESSGVVEETEPIKQEESQVPADVAISLAAVCQKNEEAAEDPLDVSVSTQSNGINNDQEPLNLVDRRHESDEPLIITVEQIPKAEVTKPLEDIEAISNSLKDIGECTLTITKVTNDK